MSLTRYKGAGILFYKREGGILSVSLGKRTVRPQKGYWSIPGGKMEAKDRSSLLDCAIRETREEYFLRNINRFPAVTINEESKCRVIIPWFFEYHTYLVNVTGIELKFNPNWEFSKIEWFNVRHLPAKTHLGVRYALLFFKLNIRKSENITHAGYI